MREYDLLIVGGGHAGAQCASAVRRFGFRGTVGLLTDEPVLPYERPPLSKDYLRGEKTPAQLALQPPAFWRDQAIDALTGWRVTALDAARHQVSSADAQVCRYGRLVWAAGGAPRRLSVAGGDLAGVHVLRTLADADGIRRDLAELAATTGTTGTAGTAGTAGSTRVVVIGGGFIGLEAAASLRKLGNPVAVVEACDRVLARVTGPELARFIEGEHRAQGVEICLNAQVAALEGGPRVNGVDGVNRVSGVRLRDGRLLPANLVIVGIGIDPAVAPLRAAGAAGSASEGGVDVDDRCRTSLEDVYAIGDCARQRNAFAGQRMTRIESVQNAVDQATLVACDVTGKAPPSASTPWFWSTQYGLRLQMAGLPSGYDDAVVRGDPASGAFAIAYLRAGVLVGVDAINAAKDFVQGRAAIGRQARPDRAALADPAVALSSFQ